MTLERITVGIDRSELADNALAWSLAAAASSDASVQAVATWQMPLICQLPAQVQGLPTPEFMSGQAADTLRATIARVADASATTFSIEERVLEGKPGPALVESAASSDLLVVGRTGYGKRHGLSRFAELVLGSTARHSVHHSHVPVATIPDGAHWAANPTVVVGVDGSDGSLAALEWALSNLPSTSKVRVVRAFEPWIGDGLVPQDLIGAEQLQADVESETQTWIDAARARVGHAGATPDVDVMIATGQHALLNTGSKPDLIVVGERSRTALASKILGSVADYVVRYAPCPVVVVPETDAV